MSIYRMNEEQIIKFVQLYKECQCLWDTNSKYYKCRPTRDKALNYISEQMQINNFGPREVAQKIKNVRSAYNQEVRRIMSRRMIGTATTDDVYIPKVPWFTIMDSILLNCLNNEDQPLELQIFKGSEDENDIELQISKNSEDENDIEAQIFGEDNKQSINKIVTPEPEPRSTPKLKRKCTFSKDVKNSTPRRKMNIEHPRASNSTTEPLERHSPPTETLDKLTEIWQVVTKLNNSETEFDLWTRSLAVQLNNMDVRRALKLQLQIQTIVSNERLEHEGQIQMVQDNEDNY